MILINKTIVTSYKNHKNTPAHFSLHAKRQGIDLNKKTEIDN